MYHLYKKTVVSKNGKSVRRWYYWFYDSTGRRKSRVCPNCTNRSEAESYIFSLPEPCAKNLIKHIAASMYLKGSEHLNRRIKLGKIVSDDTLIDSRRYINAIIQLWGDMDVSELTGQRVINDLLDINRSGSWKNRLITILKEVYEEASWRNIKVQLPVMPRFARNYKKTDIFTTEELQQLFVVENFPCYDIFVLLYLCFLCGLRLGECRAIQYSQLFFSEKLLLINGFCKQDGEKTSFLKKGSESNPKWRVVILPDIALDLLYPYLKNKHNLDDFIFVKNKMPYRMEYIEDCFQRAIIRSNIKIDGRRLIVHSLRYSYVTRMRRSVPIEIVQKLAGHTSIDMTEYYTRFSIENTIPTVLPAMDAANRLLE